MNTQAITLESDYQTADVAEFYVVLLADLIQHLLPGNTFVEGVRRVHDMAKRGLYMEFDAIGINTQYMRGFVEMYIELLNLPTDEPIPPTVFNQAMLDAWEKQRIEGWT